MMKVKNGFVVRTVAGQSMVVPLGAASKNFEGFIKLNESARMLWDMLTVGAEREDMIDRMAEAYDEVDRAVLAADCDAFIRSLQEHDILE